MRIGRRHTTESDHARDRLLQDRLLRPLVEQRVSLTLLSTRFERVGRNALIEVVSTQVKRDPRFAPVLQKLIRMTVD